MRSRQQALTVTSAAGTCHVMKHAPGGSPAVHSSPPTVAPSRARFIYLFLWFVFCRHRYVTTALAYGPEPYGYVTVVTKVRAHRADHHLPN